jgi:glutamate synthase (NADPH/NADH) large chain
MRRWRLAMNELGGKSNTGEGGEMSERYRRSRRALQALGHQAGRVRPLRVTTEYLVNSDMMQIKVAQARSPARAGSYPATRSTPRSPRSGTRPRASA